MSTTDESHHEPASIHDETAAKAGSHDAHGHDAHGHDAHGHADDHGHEVAADFIPEGSGVDTFLSMVVAPLAAIGLSLMMFLIATTPFEVEAHHEGTPEHGAQVEHAAPEQTAAPAQTAEPAPSATTAPAEAPAQQPAEHH